MFNKNIIKTKKQKHTKQHQQGVASASSPHHPRHQQDSNAEIYGNFLRDWKQQLSASNFTICESMCKELLRSRVIDVKIRSKLLIYYFLFFFFVFFFVLCMYVVLWPVHFCVGFICVFNKKKNIKRFIVKEKNETKNETCVRYNHLAFLYEFYMNNRTFDDILENYVLSLQADPTNASAHYNLSNFLWDQGICFYKNSHPIT